MTVFRGAKVQYSSGVARKQGKVNKKFSAGRGIKESEFRSGESGGNEQTAYLYAFFYWFDYYFSNDKNRNQ